MQEREKDKQAKVTVLKNPLIDSKKKQPKGFLEPSVSKMLQAAKVVERMCNQNTFDDIAQGKWGLRSEKLSSINSAESCLTSSMRDNYSASVDCTLNTSH